MNLGARREEESRFYTQKQPCSAALWEAALCSARHVQCPLSLASVKLANSRHSSFHHFYRGESWKMLPSPELLDGQQKSWEFILAVLKPVARLPWVSAMPTLHLVRARRGRAMNYNTEQSLCAFWWKRVRNQSREHPKYPEWLLPRWEMRFITSLTQGLTQPALWWGSLDTAQSLGPSVFLTTLRMEDSLLIFRICLKVLFSESDAVEAGDAQLSM